MSKYRVLLTDFAWPDTALERELLADTDAELIVADDTSAETLARLAADVQAILTCWAQVTADVLRAAPHCRHVARMGIGLDNIDVAAATKLGMLVTNVPDYCQTEVAEHTLALLLALGRRVGEFHLATKHGRYDLAGAGPLRRIAGQTLGLVGLGNIGRTVAQKAAGLGLNVIACRQSQTPVAGVRVVTFDELLEASDYVSLHLPLSDATRHLVGRPQFERMKPTAFLINTSRGGLVDSGALAEALAAGQVAGAGLDVQEPEPPDLSQPPWNDPRVIVTPHAAFASLESVEELRRRAVGQVIEVLQGRRPPNVVNARK